MKCINLIWIVYIKSELKTAEGDNFFAEYFYGADGFRSGKKVNGVSTEYVYDGMYIIGESVDGVNYTYSRGTDLLGYTSSLGETVYYRTNVHGDVKELVNVFGESLERYEYNAYGAEDEDYNPFRRMFGKKSVHNPFRYTGEYTDSETGLVYLRNRYYSPSIGRFISEDPAKSGLNWYAYCEGNPVNFFDPWGLYKEGDEKLPEAIQIIINGNDKKTGGLTEAYSIAKENNDVEAMTRISITADNLREYSTDNIISITVLLNSSGATFLGHTATIITNDKNQSIIFSYHPFPDGSPTSEPGEMRVAYLNSMQTKYVLSNKLNEFYLVGSTGYNRTESFDDNLTLEVDSNGGYKSLKKASEIFASPGNYNVLINNCDHQTSEIVRASGMFYDKYIFPNKSFDYTRSYYDHPAIWRLLSEKR